MNNDGLRGRLSHLGDKIRAAVDGFLAYLARLSASGSRSSVLGTALVLLGLVLAALLAAISAGASAPVISMLQVFCGVAFGLCSVGYVYFALTNPDFLRSERYTLERLRIEKGLLGDSVSGFRQIGEGGPPGASGPTQGAFRS